MQIANNSTPPPVNWRKLLDDAERDEPPIERRGAVRLSEDALYALVDFESDIFCFDPERIGWDLHRQHGGPDGAGHDMFDTMMAACGMRRDPQVWAAFDRPRADSDLLIIDVMNEAVGYGFKAPPEVLDEIEKLRDVQAARAAQRKAADKARDAAVFARLDRFCDLDEAAYGDWLDDGRPEGRALKFARWKARDAAEDEELARYDAKRKLKSMLPAPFQIVPAAPPKKLIQSSGEFVGGFVAPSYLLDGILQRHFVYAMTGATGCGKTAIALRFSAHVALGRKLGERDVERGRILYFASENSVDVQARWLAMAEHCGFDVNTIDAHFISGATKLSEIAERVTIEAKALGDLALVVVDTSAATFEGADENSNVDGLQHAKRMRSLTDLQGGPTVLVLCHPVKSATNDNLAPRGGGSFVAEIDGNLCVRKNDSSVEVHWAVKFRGMDFAPMAFRLDTVTAARLKDARGRNIPTVLATPIDEAAKQVLAASERSDQDRVLRAIYDRPGESSNDVAKHLGWKMRDGKPYGVRVRRACERLAGDGLVLKHRGAWVLSARGEKELNNLDRVRAGTATVPVHPPFPLPGLPH